MSTSTRSTSSISEWKELLVDFGLPALVLIMTGLLIFSGRDGELKTVFAASAGWLFKSGIARAKK